MFLGGTDVNLEIVRLALQAVFGRSSPGAGRAASAGSQTGAVEAAGRDTALGVPSGGAGFRRGSPVADKARPGRNRPLSRQRQEPRVPQVHLPSLQLHELHESVHVEGGGGQGRLSAWEVLQAVNRSAPSAARPQPSPRQMALIRETDSGNSA